MHTISRRINHDSICFPTFFEEFSGKNLCFVADEFDIFHPVALCIFLTVSTRIRYELDRIHLLKVLRQENPNRPCSCIEIKENPALMMDKVDCLRIESLRTKGVHLEKTLRLNLE